MSKLSLLEQFGECLKSYLGQPRDTKIDVSYRADTMDTVVEVSTPATTVNALIRQEELEDFGVARIAEKTALEVKAQEARVLGDNATAQMIELRQVALQHVHRNADGQQAQSMVGTLAGSIGSSLGGVMGGIMGGGGSAPAVRNTQVVSTSTGTFQIGGPADDPFEMNGGSVATKIMRMMKSEAIEAMLGGKPDDRAIHMIAREIVRVIRTVGDDVFEKADVNPEYHRENFVKVIDAVMKEL